MPASRVIRFGVKDSDARYTQIELTREAIPGPFHEYKCRYRHTSDIDIRFINIFLV